MATPAEPVTDALFSNSEQPRTAIEEVRQIASQNVIAVLGAQITEMKGRDEGRVFRSQLADRHAGEGGLAG